jgi:large subunit ribosomal protein L21
MKFAIIETGGKQYRIEQGQTFHVEKLAGATEGENVLFDKVLLLCDEGKVEIGAPYLEGTVIECAYEGDGRNAKVTTIKYKQKSNYFKKRGHRQTYSKVTVTKIK